MENSKKRKIIADPEIIMLLLSIIGASGSLVAIANGLDKIKERRLIGNKQIAQRKFIKAKLLDLYSSIDELLELLYSSATYYNEGHLDPHKVEFKFGSGTLWIPQYIFNQYVEHLGVASRIQNKIIVNCSELSSLFPELDSLDREEINKVIKIKIGLDTLINNFNEKVFRKNLSTSYLFHSDIIESLDELLRETNTLLKELESLMGKDYD